MTNHTTQPAVDRLRFVLRANATFSFASGTAALLGGSWISRVFGIDHVLLTRLLGAGLLGFAALVMAISRLDEPRLRTEAALVSAADAAWVLGTVVVLLTGSLSTAGNVVMAVVALVVADFGATQLWFRSRAFGDRPDLHTATT